MAAFPVLDRSAAVRGTSHSTTQQPAKGQAMKHKIIGSVLALVLAGTAMTLVPSVGGAGAARQSARDNDQGSKIAFSRLCEVAGCPQSVEDQQTEIWVMNDDGTDPRQLTHNTTWDLGPVWSPDGRTVAFFGAQFDPATDTPLAPPHVYLINADGTDQRLLTPAQAGRWPRFSPDGTKIAFDDGDPSSGDIWVVNADGTDARNLTKDRTARNIRPDWSPDGQKIVFARSGDIYLMNADGSDPAQLTGAGSDNAPAWSPDGQKIVFQSHRDGNDEIYVMNADGSDQTRLTNYPGRDDNPSWSPDGDQIAFHRDLQGTQILEIYVMNADGSDPTPLTGLPTENAHPGWSHGPETAQ